MIVAIVDHTRRAVTLAGMDPGQIALVAARLVTTMYSEDNAVFGTTSAGALTILVSGDLDATEDILRPLLVELGFTATWARMFPIEEPPPIVYNSRQMTLREAPVVEEEPQRPSIIRELWQAITS